MRPFTAEEDAKLCELVGQSPPLYDLTVKQYKDRNLKETIWRNIAKVIGRTADDSKKRWKTIRDTYNRNKNKRLSSSAKSTKVPKWALLDSVSFLAGFDYSRRNKSNIPEQESPSIVKHEDEEEENDDDTYKDDDDDDLVTEPSDSSNHSVQNEQNVDSSTNPTSSSTTNEMEIGKGRSDSYNFKRLRLSANIKNADNVEESRKLRKESLQQTTNNRESAEDHIDTFFKSMADSVKTLNPKLQLEAKRQVFQVVSNLEFLQIMNKNK